jgi:uncharacterized protein (DUF1015 family)
MAEIVPFSAVLYNAERAGALEYLVAPPYDVISPEEQLALYAVSPYNCVRIILNRQEADDTPQHNPYTRAAEFLHQWLKEGVLREAEPALYVYQQEFTHPTHGQRCVRTGFFGALKLEPYSSGIVLPHEETRRKAREDRLNLLRATATNTEPIMGMFDDPQSVVSGILHEAEGETFSVVVGEDRHTVRAMRAPEAVKRIQAQLQNSRIWIADGHHRYETALAYRDERRAAEGNPAGLKPYDYLLVVLVPFHDPGLVVLPTHRLVKNIPESRLERLLPALQSYFDMEAMSEEKLDRMAQESAPPGTYRLGMLTADKIFLLTLRDEAVLDRLMPTSSAVWRRLDVSILQVIVFERVLGIAAEQVALTPDIGYTRDRREAIQSVRSGAYQLAFFMNLPSVEAVRLVAAAGEKMPPKSTYFYPKLWSGLVMRRMAQS